MARDIREILKESNTKEPTLSEGHISKFEAKMDAAFPVEKKQFLWGKVAAIAIVLISVAYFGYNYLSNFTGDSIDNNVNPIVQTDKNETTTKKQISLGDLSPDLKKVEDYYLAGINVQLASLKINPENKALVDGYMKQLSELDKEYKNLSIELNKVGPTEATITALIDNLKMRLELLFKLKNKLNEFKTQENEQIDTI
jgi:hypothetical protein